MKKTRADKIKEIEEAIAKSKADLAKHEASLKIEREKLRDEQYKTLEGICKNGKFTVNDIIELADTIVRNNITIEDVISVIGDTKKE